MSKVLDATCVGSVVTVEGKTVEADILSQGTASSSGKVLLDGQEATYVTSNASDLEDTIDSIDTILAKIIEIVTTLDGVTVSPGSAAANIALLTALKVQFALTKDNLK